MSWQDIIKENKSGEIINAMKKWGYSNPEQLEEEKGIVESVGYAEWLDDHLFNIITIGNNPNNPNPMDMDRLYRAILTIDDDAVRQFEKMRGIRWVGKWY